MSEFKIEKIFLQKIHKQPPIVNLIYNFIQMNESISIKDKCKEGEDDDIREAS